MNAQLQATMKTAQVKVNVDLVVEAYNRAASKNTDAAKALAMMFLFETGCEGYGNRPAASQNWVKMAKAIMNNEAKYHKMGFYPRHWSEFVSEYAPGVYSKSFLESLEVKMGFFG